jgi:hypothetical protein
MPVNAATANDRQIFLEVHRDVYPRVKNMRKKQYGSLKIVALSKLTGGGWKTC